jgi:hypothetical protein
MSRASLFVLSLLAACALAPTPSPADAETLLFFNSREGTGSGAVELLHVVRLDAHAEPRVLWRGGAHALARLDRDHVLLLLTGGSHGLVVADLANGTHRLLAADGDFVAVHGDEVLYLGTRRWDATDNYLYAAPWAAAGPRRRLAEQRFADVLLLVGNLAFAVTEECEVWVVDVLAASGRAVWKPPVTASARESSPTYHHTLRVALSPSGRRVAIGSALGKWGEGELTVVDLATAAVLRSWCDLPIRISHLSSFSPTVEVGWSDDDVVVCSETRGVDTGSWSDDEGVFVYVGRSVTSGTVTSERRYARIDLYHTRPPAPGSLPPASTAAFSKDVVDDTIRLLHAGSPVPLMTFDNGADIDIAPDRQSAFARNWHGGPTLLTAAEPEGRRLLDGWGQDPVWLPIGGTTNSWMYRSRCQVLPAPAR